MLIERNVFLDSFDELHELGSDVPASTAAHNSARFAYVSPAGDLGDKKGLDDRRRIFREFGALTALELARAAEAALNPPKQKPKVKLVFLLISSDPDLDDPSPGKRTAPVRIDEPASSIPGNVDIGRTQSDQRFVCPDTRCRGEWSVLINGPSDELPRRCD